jgi:hypothetical protein
MKNSSGLRKLFPISSLVIVIATSACGAMGALPFGGDSWQEEVQLHDGRKQDGGDAHCGAGWAA